MTFSMKTKLLYTFLFLIVNKMMFAQQDCFNQESGLFTYFNVLENVTNLDTNFNKTDFINFLSTNENISPEDLAILNTEIVSVSQSFPTAQSEFLQKVVDVDATSDIFDVISEFNSSISLIECRNFGTLLSNENFEINNDKIKITSNPINEATELIISSNILKFEIVIVNSLGQIVFKNQFLNDNSLYLDSLIKESGFYILSVTDLNSNQIYSLKVFK